MCTNINFKCVLHYCTVMYVLTLKISLKSYYVSYLKIWCCEIFQRYNSTAIFKTTFWDFFIFFLGTRVFQKRLLFLIIIIRNQINTTIKTLKYYVFMPFITEKVLFEYSFNIPDIMWCFMIFTFFQYSVKKKMI